MPANGGNVTEAKRPLQFTLRTLLLIVSSLAATLGAVRWLGAEVLPFIVVAVGIWLFAWGLSSFPSLGKAIAKNGSISAYAFCSANLGMYVSVLTSLGGGGVVWQLRWFRQRKVA